MGWSQVLENEVRRAVLENTSDVEPRRDSCKLVEKFFSDQQTVDIVYEKIMERVQTDRTRNPLILLRSLGVLKKYLVNFMPSLAVIETLDQFCCSVAATDPQTRKTLIYIRALLGRKRYHPSSDTPVISRQTQRRTTLSNFNSSTPKRIMAASWNATGLREARAQLQEAILRSNWIAANNLVLRQRPNFDTLLGMRHVLRTLATHPYFCPFSIATQHIDTSNERFVIEQHRIEERIKTVRAAKKAEENAACKNAGITNRRNSIKLFQFKYYNQQEPLQLSEQELDQVVTAVIGTQEGNYETRLIASKILIKVLVDRFINDAEDASKFFTNIVTEMFETDEEESQLHAFNLLFNLSVHFNLWEDMTIIDFEGGTQSNEPSEGMRKVIDVQHQLFEVLQEMLRILLQCEESSGLVLSPRVWNNALNCLLFWTTKDGKFQKDMLNKVEITLFPAFLKHSNNLGDFTQRHLIRILTCILYEKHTLSTSQLKKIGGINWVIDQYISVRSTEAQDNLFVVIYDNVVSNISSKKNIARGYILNDNYLDLLKRINAPQLFAKFFRFAPTKFVESIVHFICGDEEWNLSISLDGTTESLDKKTLRKLFKQFKLLAQKYLALPGEFTKLYQASVDSGDLSALASFLKSNRADNRKYAELWLFQLLSEHWLGSRKNPSAIGKEAHKLFVALVHEDREPLVHHCHATYISIIERLVLFLSFQTSDEQRNANLQTITSLLNEYLLKVLEQETLDEENTRKIFDVIWGFSYFANVHRHATDPYSETTPNDCIYSLYVRGSAILPQQLKNEIDIRVFAFMFDNLMNKNYSEIRLAVLLVMIEKSMEPDNLEEIGGIPFFRKLLASRDPAVAYHASRFLIDQLEAEKPEEYKDIMSAFLNKAQQTKNETLVANSYLQIKALIRSSETGKI